MNTIPRLCAIAALALGMSATASTSEAWRPNNDLRLADMPLPVQAYVFREAIRFGIHDPWNLAVQGTEDGSELPYDIAGSPLSDLNMDGERDYEVQLCWFGSSTQFTPVGNPCAFGGLILSRDGGYEFIDIRGHIVASSPDPKEPHIIVQERGWGRCDGGTFEEYFCDVLYRLVRPHYWSELKELQICKPGECNLEQASRGSAHGMSTGKQIHDRLTTDEAEQRP